MPAALPTAPRSSEVTFVSIIIIIRSYSIAFPFLVVFFKKRFSPFFFFCYLFRCFVKQSVFTCLSPVSLMLEKHRRLFFFLLCCRAAACAAKAVIIFFSSAFSCWISLIFCAYVLLRLHSPHFDCFLSTSCATTNKQTNNEAVYRFFFSLPLL